jgi:hypothetical protein
LAIREYLQVPRAKLLGVKSLGATSDPQAAKLSATSAPGLDASAPRLPMPAATPWPGRPSLAACHAARTQPTAHRAGCLGARIVSSGDGVPPAMSAKRAQRVGRVRMRKVGRSATFHVAMPRCTATCHDATPLSHVATWHAVAPCARAARNVSHVLRRPRARRAPCERDGATGNARVWPSRSMASATIRSSPSCVLVTSLPLRPSLPCGQQGMPPYCAGPDPIRVTTCAATADGGVGDSHFGGACNIRDR